MPLLLLLLVVLPLCELALLLWVAQHTHWTAPLSIVIGTGLIGLVLLRLQGWRTASKIKAALAAGQAPTDALLDAGLLLLAAGMLMTPGLMTDVAGLSLAAPGTRGLWRGMIRRRIQVRLQGMSGGVWGPGPGDPRDEPDGPLDGPPHVVQGRVVENDEGEDEDGAPPTSLGSPS